MDDHTHQFVVVANIDRTPTDTQRAIPGAVVACAMCGEVREVFADGLLRMWKAGRLQK